MSRRASALVAAVTLFAVAALAAPVAAAPGGGPGGGAGNGSPVTGVPAVVLFLGGTVLLVYSAEKFIGYLVTTANGLDISLFLLAVLFAGVEFDDAILGVATNLEDLGGVALGTVFGTAISLTGVTLALAALFEPFEVTVPRDYLALFGLSPIVLVPFVLRGGFTTEHGLVLIGCFGGILAYIVYRETQIESPVFRDTEIQEIVDGGRVEPVDTDVPFVPERERSGWTWLGLSVAALAGLVVSAEAMAVGTDGILATYGLDGTVFGATVVTGVLIFEDVFLTVEPVRRGVPEVGIGNVIGSVLFSVTGNVGVIVLVGDIAVGRNVLAWHVPMLVVVTAVAAVAIGTGRLKRWHGALLLALFVCYWTVSLLVFGGIPFDA